MAMDEDKRKKVYKSLEQLAWWTVESWGRLPRKSTWSIPVGDTVTEAELDEVWNEVLKLPWATRSVLNEKEEAEYQAWLQQKHPKG